MRKFASILLVTALVLSLAITAYAVSYNNDVQADIESMIVHKVPLEEFAYIPSDDSSATISPRVSQRLEFAGYSPEVLVPYSQRFQSFDNDIDILTIENAVWAPEHYDVEIGFYHIDSETCYGHTYDSCGTSGISRTRYFNIPEGECWVYVINHGDSALSTGYLLFSVG